MGQKAGGLVAAEGEPGIVRRTRPSSQDAMDLTEARPSGNDQDSGDGIVTDKNQRTSSGSEFGELGELVNGKRFSRRGLIKGAAAMGAAAALGPIAAACGGDDTTTDAASSPAAGTPNKGGDLMVGIVGSSAKDTADPHTGSFEPDIAIQYIMYEGLTAWDFDLNLTNQLAETIEPNADGTVWQVTLRDGVMWHDGKPVTADDVVFSLDRIVDPKDPKVAPPLSPASPRAARRRSTTRRSSSRSRRRTYSGREPGGTRCKIVPVGFDPKNPIGTGPFKRSRGSRRVVQWMPSPTTGTRPELRRPHDDRVRRRHAPSTRCRVDRSTRCPAPKTGRGDRGDGRPRAPQRRDRPVASLHRAVDVKPFDDVRVRQAFRLIVDRQQVIDQASAASARRQRHVRAVRRRHARPAARAQDIEQAKSLLKQAGYDNDLTVELVTSGARWAATRSRRRRCSPSRPRRPRHRRPQEDRREHLLRRRLPVLAVRAGFWATRGFLAQASRARCPMRRTTRPTGSTPVAVPGPAGVHHGRRRYATRWSAGLRDRVQRGRHHLGVAQPVDASPDDHRLGWTSSPVPSADVLQGRLLRVS